MPPMPVLQPVSPQALASAHLIMAIMFIGAGIFVLVSAVTIVVIIRFRERPGQPFPSQVFGQRHLEIAWTVSPALLLAVIFVITLASMAEAEPVSPGAMSAQAPALTGLGVGYTAPPQPDLIVTGHQWWWQVQYPAAKVTTANEIYLPVGKRFLVELLSADVIHSLWIPNLGPKVDLIPGQTDYMWLEADKTGVYHGQCSEFCGTGHAWMQIYVYAVSPQQFATWEQQEAQPAASPTSAPAVAGAQLFQQDTCVDCHTVAGTSAAAQIGPDLTHFASRQYLGGGVLTNTPQHVEEWLQNPQDIKPGAEMPNYRLTAPQLQDLTAYLETLK